VLTFMIDQALHFAVIASLTSYIFFSNIAKPTWLNWNPDATWIVVVTLTALLLLLPCGGLLIGSFVQPYQDQLAEYYKASNKPRAKGLTNGGRIIGNLERTLIFFLVLLGQYGGIAFLIAAKSIFRFGELRESENRMEAEYIIIGTFASFLYAIAISTLAVMLIKLE
jgi:hypothetical protein